MRILFAASEVYPLAKTGGLADVTGSLPKALAARGHDVGVVLPRYGSGPLRAPEPDNLGAITVPMGQGKTETAALQRTFLDPGRRVPAYLVGHEAHFNSRKELYGFPDDGFRFAFFARAALEAVRALDLRPEVIHAHDWHAGLIPAYLKLLGGAIGLQGPPALVFSIHNLAYQGIWGLDVFAYTALPPSCLSIDGLEYHGNVSFLKAGTVYSDRVNTVSPTYAAEIQTPELGHGLDGLLRHHRGKLSGIINGIDYEVWNPATDPYLPFRFGPDDLSGKGAAKRALQRELGLEVGSERPLVSFIGRLVEQKGMGLIMANLPRLLKEAELVILGTGDPAYHRALEAVDAHGSLALRLRYDEDLAHRIYAASDAFLMPSLFEPCGLGQLVALRYGALPIVRATGGLRDTVRDADRDPERGTGFAFEDFRPEALAEAFDRALRAYRDRPRWTALVARAMAQDFSWSASTLKYEELYRSAMR